MADYDGLPDDEIWNIDFGELNFTQEIARGSFGKVYKGTYLGVDVAIKQIFRHDDPAYMKYIEREISVLKGIRHPFIVGFCGVCLHDTGLYIVTEFIDGGDVRSLLKSNPPSWDKRVQMASDLAKAMFYLHSKKIIHRDLKSKNLLIGSDNRVRLCDFGFARMSEFQSRQAMTICGTPGFVAPEIMLGLDYDESCDVFSYGNVLAELITLKRPGRDFWIRTAEEKYFMMIDEIDKISGKDCPSSFLDLAKKCVSYDPNKRPIFADIVKALKVIEASTKSQDVQKTASGTSGGGAETPRGILSSHRSPTITSPVPETKKEQAAPPQGESFMHTIASQKIQLTSGEEKISAKHVAKMIVRATSPDYIDSDYMQDLLFSYPCFSSPQEMIELLMQRYSGAAISNDTPASPTHASSAIKKLQVVQIRVVIFLNTWIEKFCDDFADATMKDLLGKFDNLVASSSKDPLSFQKAFEKAVAKKAQNRPFAKELGMKKTGLGPELLKIPTMEFARQETLIESSAFRSVDQREYLKETWKKREDSCLKLLFERPKELARFVATAIVSIENFDQRTSMIERFIEIAQAFVSLKNYNAMFGVIAGLKHPSIERLTKTFANSRASLKEQMKTLVTLTTKDNSYSSYRSKQETTQAPSVPFFEPYLEEIAFVDSFNPDIGKGGIINFSKHRKLARMMRYLEQCKSAPYNDLGEPKIFIRDVLLYSQLDDDDTLQKKSFKCEPPSAVY